MISYILLSALLLTAGVLLYILFFKDRVSAFQAKALLSVLLFISFVAPYFVPGLPNYSKLLNEGLVFHEDYTQWNVVDIKDEKLLECYNKAVDSKDICDCEIIQKSAKVTFVYNPVYTFFIAYGWYFLAIFYAISSLFLLIALLRLASLIYLAKKSSLKMSELNGFRYYILYPFLKNQLPLSAFSLFKNYVIWSPILNTLKDSEKDIVISHELSHLRNKDSWYVFLFELMKSFFWITPAYFWFIREFKKQQEYIADEEAASVAGSNKQYAALLLRLKEWQLLNAKAFSFSLSLNGSVFKKRILRLVNPKKRKFKNSSFVVSSILFVLLIWFFAFKTLPFIQKQEIQFKHYEILAESNK